MEIFGISVVVILLIVGCYFVNNTKAKHGTCCGKGCRGCEIYEKNKKG